ncbi:MAG TPA: hypothetical protein VHB77_00810 [Planctomycetaceae bacterium]|nr:hypothetical protein [Planctomycetaceae bacterium]
MSEVPLTPLQPLAPPPLPPAATGGMPQWFVRRRALRADEQKPIVVATDEEATHRTWKEWFVAWIHGREPRAYVVSFVLHFIILASLSFVLIRSNDGPLGISTLIGINGQDVALLPLDNTTETTIELEGGESADKTADMLSELTSNDLLGELSAEHMSVFAQGLGEGKGDQTGNSRGLGGGFALPITGKFVSKGSFTAWTVPEDPAPGETYSIVIQVDYGKAGKQQRWGDVTGTVVGTDGYRKTFNSKNSLYISKAGQIIVKIPGAAENIRDVINVRSEILKESQQLEIVF